MLQLTGTSAALLKNQGSCEYSTFWCLWAHANRAIGMTERAG